MNYTDIFNKIKRKCIDGNVDDINKVMDILKNADLPITRAVDFYLEFLQNQDGIDRLEYFLFNGTLIQRNYCTLYFARRNCWDKVNRAYDLGLIDKIQAYSR